jgi:hypothetical protein
MTTRPLFLNTKGERKLSTFLYDPLERYRIIAKGVYEWSGFPEDVPEGFIEEALFDYGCVGAKDVTGLGLCIFPASALTKSIYGQPLSWIPTGTYNFANSSLIMNPSDNPVLDLGVPMAEKIEMFAGIMKSSLISLQQNVIALRQPIALDGVVGNGVEALILSSELESGEMYIPVIDSDKLGIKVIELGAVDHTQALIATFNAMDSEILSIMGIKNVGTEKASGITTEETLSISQELNVVSDFGLKKRLEWCNKINSILGTSFNVKLAEAFEPEDDTMTQPEEKKEAEEL